MKSGRTIWLGLLLAVASWAGHAQSDGGSVEPYEEYGKHLRAAQEVTPLTSELFGDKVSLYNGAGEFDVTDIDLPGNSSLPVRLSRRLEVDDRRQGTGNLHGFGEWDLDVPYLDGTFDSTIGWMATASGNVASGARCSLTTSPFMTVNGVAEPAYVIWDGNQLHIPGVVDEELLKNTQAKLPGITDGKSYPWVTKSLYRATCASSTANGYPGESFIVVTPGGVRYTFNWAVVRSTAGLMYQRPNPYGKGTVKWGSDRVRVYLLATRIEDRFGNWVTYSYNASSQLTSIKANDGREIDLDWTGDIITSASAGARTWHYGYTAPGTNYASYGLLNTVTQPDGTQWTYTTVSGSLKTVRAQPDTEPPPQYHCQLDPDPNTGDFVYSISAPSGAKGTFHFVYQRNRRSYVPLSCTDATRQTNWPPYLSEVFDNFALVHKQITGAGLTDQNWAYDYGIAGGYYTAPIGYDDWLPPYILTGCGTCGVSKVVTVTGPGDITKYTFGVQYSRNEGRLLKTETDALDGTVAKTVVNTYLDDDAEDVASEPFPGDAGSSVQPAYKNPMVGRIRPVIATTTEQDGDTYTRQIESFDAFAQPAKVKRSNNIAGQQAIEEQTTYYNDLTHWVLGQPQQVDNVTNAGQTETESHRDYDSATALMTSQSRFGQALLSYTYNAQGQLASFTDGNSHTTTLGNYYRGIPRLVHYANQTSQSAEVDDYGEITSVTDQAGRKTTYTYLPSGWPSEIVYPADDEVSWMPKHFQFDYVTAAEHGIAGGHWRRTVNTGNNVEVTYFDAMLHPLLSDSYLAGTTGSDIVTSNSYDWRGLATFSSYPDAPGQPLVGTRTTYDTLGRPVQVQQDSELGVLTSTTAYLSGAGIRTVDARGKTTTTHYQVFDEPSTDAPIKVEAPEGVTQAIARDVYGKPLSITQSGVYGTETDKVVKTLLYDSYHRLCRTSEPESGNTVMAYDGANNLQWSAAGLNINGTGCGQDQVTAAARTVITYDELNRPQTIAPPAGTQSTSYAYAPTGEVTWTNSGSAIWENHYNYRGMLTSETLHMAGTDARTLAYAHDAYGSVSQVTYPDGETVAYAPDARGRPQKVGTYANSIDYFPNGQVKQFAFGNGTGYVAKQNTRQLASIFSYGNDTTINLSEELTYDNAGNIVAVDDSVGPRSKTFQYDGLNRLTSAVALGLWGTESYTYDPINNLRTRLTAGQTSIYSYDASVTRLLAITRGGVTTGSFNYDTRGNMTSRNGVTLQFDQKNQLLQVQGYDSYLYDAAGRRVKKTPASGTPTFYLYDGAGQLMYQYDPGSSQGTNFIYLGTRLIADHASLALAQPGAVDFDANPNNGSYTVSWGATPLATSYVLQERFDDGAWMTVYTGGGTSVALGDREGGDYVYQVQASATDGTETVHSGWTLSATLGVTPKIAVVSGPTTVVFGPYTVNWTTPIGAVTYDVQESLDGGAWATIASDTTATSIGRPGDKGGDYAYRILAKNSHGNRGWSAPITVAVTQVPNVPTDFVPVTGTDGTYVQLTWDAMRFATSYELTQYRTGIHLGFQTISLSNNSYDVQHLPPNEVIFELKACSIAGCSAPVRVGGNTALTPALPTVTGPSTLVFGTYTVSWTASSGATAYDVEERVGDGDWVNIANHITATSIARPGTAGGSYQYQVSAWNGAGSRGWSDPATVAVTQVPDKPTNFIFTTDEYGDSILSWDAMPFASSYQLTVNGTNGNLGTYIYNVGDSSFVVPEGNYQVSRLAACSIAGCSVSVQVSGHGGGLGDTAAKRGKAKPGRMESGTPAAPSGCTATSCQAVIGGAP